MNASSTVTRQRVTVVVGGSAVSMLLPTPACTQPIVHSKTILFPTIRRMAMSHLLNSIILLDLPLDHQISYFFPSEAFNSTLLSE
jgi:hypothetical protein